MNKLKRPAQVLGLLLVIAVALWRVATLAQKTQRPGRDRGDVQPLPPGTQAPDFTLNRITSGQVSLEKLLRKKGAFLWFYDPG